MTMHSIQLEEGEFGRTILLMPLEPQPVLYVEENISPQWAWDSDAVSCSWLDGGPPPPQMLDALRYREGHCLYHQEEWGWGFCTVHQQKVAQRKSEFDPTTFPGNFEIQPWQPAKTMPPEAAGKWRKITRVRVVPANCHKESTGSRHNDIIDQCWSALIRITCEYPELWIIALDVEDCSSPLRETAS